MLKKILLTSSILIAQDSDIYFDYTLGSTTYLFGTEGLSEYVPGSGILFVEGVHATIAGTAGVTITFT